MIVVALVVVVDNNINNKTVVHLLRFLPEKSRCPPKSNCWYFSLRSDVKLRLEHYFGCDLKTFNAEH